MVLEACVLLPLGFYDAERAGARYPLVVSHGHYSPVLDDWSERAPLGCDPAVYACVAAWYGHCLFRNWTRDRELPEKHSTGVCFV